jgi:hypothetical protein
MRITNNMLINNMLNNLNNNLNRMNKYQNQLATGKKISLPSDDPIVASRALKLRTDVAEIQQYKRNVDDANSWMDITETTLGQMGNVMHRVRELAVQAANETNTPEDLDKIKQEMGQLKVQMVHLANTTYAGRYIFSDFDRQMYIVKELHEKGRTTAYLGNKLWISDRTIDEDLAKLRSYTGVSIMGQKIRVRGIERQKGNIEFQSTVHPIFLALNLTQVVVLLQGLQHMIKDEAYKEYALKLSANIWNELSDYARRRIKQVTGMLSMDLSWYEELDSYSSEELFYTERECSYDERAGNVLDFLKNGKKCAIEFIGSNGESNILTNCIIDRYNPNREEIEVTSNDEKHAISMNAIVKTKHEAKHLY